MPREEDFSFSFVSKALAEDTFTVAEFKGSEGISTLYEFEIMLYADDPEIDLKAVLQNPATLTIIPEGEEERTIHGIPAVFEQLQEYDDYIYYRVKLVPRLWLADQYHENALFLDKKVPQVIEEILKQAGLTSQDYELKLTGDYKAWEYICQYNESDFDFISRWMEREGIYYYFDQSGDAEKLIITDSATAHKPIKGKAVTYSPPGRPTPSIYEQVREFTCRQQILPKKVLLKDYNYRKPTLDLKGEADVDSDGRGNVYIYGEHFKTPEEGNALAKIRAEELLCREAIFYGEGMVSPFLPGYLFELEAHYRDSYNKKYLLTEVSHQGVQADFLAMAADTSRLTELKGPAYQNLFTCIPDTLQFRPERKTTRPRIDSTLNAKVDSAGDGQYAEIDDEGRYKVTLPFDMSGNKDGKASRWVRMAQPYAGADYGMHFPLHKGTEVLLTFIDGDPDRPIIAGSVPNPETGSPVKAANQSQSMIRTGGGNQIRIEDSQGNEQIHLSSPYGDTRLSLGAPNQGQGVFLRSDHHLVIEMLRDMQVEIDGMKKEKIGLDVKKFYGGAEHSTVVGLTSKLIGGVKHETVAGAELKKNKGLKAEFISGAVIKSHKGKTYETNPNQEEKKGKMFAHIYGMSKQFVGSWWTESKGNATIKSAGKMLQQAANFQVTADDVHFDSKQTDFTVKSMNIDSEKYFINALEMELEGNRIKTKAKVDFNNGILKISK